MELEKILKEVQYRTARSGGAGGQHVNKVETKVTLQWDIANSLWFDEETKAMLQNRLANRINKDGLLQLESSATRSQTDNKEDVKRRFIKILQDSLKKPKKRIPTKISKSKILERLDRKKQQSQKKQQRKKLDF